MNLVGTWILDEAETAARNELGDVMLNFAENSELTYVIRGEETDQVIYLDYRVDGATIVTDQPSAPREERTAFSQPEADVLVLAFGGRPRRFRRVDSPLA